MSLHWPEVNTPPLFIPPARNSSAFPPLFIYIQYPAQLSLGPGGPPLPQLPLNPWHAPSLLFSDKSPFDPPFAPPRNYVDSRQAALIGSQGALLPPLPARNRRFRFNKSVTRTAFPFGFMRLSSWTSQSCFRTVWQWAMKLQACRLKHVQTEITSLSDSDTFTWQ